MRRVTQLALFLLTLVAGYTLSARARAGPQEVSADTAAGLYGGACCPYKLLPAPTYPWCADPITPTCGRIYTDLAPGKTVKAAGKVLSCTDMCPDGYPEKNADCGTGDWPGCVIVIAHDGNIVP